MRLTHFLRFRRYERCRQIFRAPWQAYLRIAAGRPQPLDLDLVEGGTLHVPNARACRSLFHWILETAPDPLPVTLEGGLVTFNYQGRRIALRPNSEDFFVFQEIFLADAYGINRLEERLGTVVDLGANIGLFALRMAPLTERIVAVEPVAANLKIAARTIRRADPDCRISLRKCAVTGESGRTARVYLSAGSAAGHSLRPDHAVCWQTAGYEDVPTISLADLLAREAIERCDLLKCDVEGAEYEIFRAASPEVLARIDRIALELHFTAGKRDVEQFQHLLRQFAAAGLHVDHEPLRDARGRLQSTILLHASRLAEAGVQRRAA